MNAQALIEKLARLRGGEAPRVLDLFAGCGGMSLGCELAGAEILAGIELDPAGVQTYAANFHSHETADLVAFHSTPRDITRTAPHDFVHHLAPSVQPRRLVDVIVAGPPCQAFARVGRAKLREISRHPEAFLFDERATLYQQVLLYVRALQPLAVVVENVPDVLNFGGVNLFESMALALEKLGFNTRYGLLNAVHYGVPQMRDRCFLVALSRTADVDPTLPQASHRWLLPRGYLGTREVALRGIDLFSASRYLSTPLGTTRSLREGVSAQAALGDLPRLTDHLRGETRKVPQRLDKPVPFPDSPHANEFIGRMRDWPGHESTGLLFDHVIRYLPRDYPLFARMRPGDQYPEAHRLALKMRDKELARLSARFGRPLSTAEEGAITKRIVPPYDPCKFPNKWRKMEPDMPARTLMAHLGKDTYSHIHYDSAQARPISVREAARLQSFPDGFRFSGTMNPAFRQIGNAVPPLLAHAVFSEVLRALRDRAERAQDMTPSRVVAR